MKRVCVIDVAGLSLRLLAREKPLWINHLLFSPRPMRPTLPVLTASVQASMTTGVEPGVHGVIAGGIYRRQCREISFYERSNTLLNKKRFWHSRHLPQRPRTALVFWANPLAGAADVVIGANTYYSVAGDMAEHPAGEYQRLAEEIGQFDARTLWGHKASWRAGQWIVQAALRIWQRHRPDLQWVYLPGLNYELVRHGMDSPQALEAMRELDGLAKALAAAVAAEGGQTIIVSDGGYVPVSRVSFPNARLREAGLLKARQARSGRGWEIDFEASRAFAMADHQVAYLYCADDESARAAAPVLAADPAVGALLNRDESFASGLGHDRAGELVALAAGDAWFGYQLDDTSLEASSVLSAEAKAGFDPCELLGPDQAANPFAVRASRGLIPDDGADQCVIAATCELPFEGPIKVTDVPEVLKRVLFGQVDSGVEAR